MTTPRSSLRPEAGIILRKAGYRFPHVTVLGSVDFSVPKGGTCVVTGANGSGKSTLLYLCAGLIGLQQGTLTLGGHRADARRPSDLLRRGVRRGFVFQEGGLVSNMNALANVALPLRYHADALGLTLGDVEKRAVASLERVGVRRDDFYSLPAHLSFGVRKRVALARAIAVEPNFFYFDDPDVGLDPKTAALLHEILVGYRDDPQVTMVVATNRDILVDRLRVPGYVLINGRLIERQYVPISGPPSIQPSVPPPSRRA